MTLTAIQEDYLEVIYHLGKDSDGVRTSEVAARLGCRMPTVSRTVQKMVEMGLVHHKSRGLIRLTDLGMSTAENIAHRHKDIVTFLRQILGMTANQAEADACQIEHGLSPLAAQRLHEFLEYVKDLSEREQSVITKFARIAGSTITDFPHLLETKVAGWRG
ncbi:MAG: helix-turn-helix domain-containing protein [candidate division Zixibacteria bacterium]|nr:helix-turn-helix domain-containing protein [candidate division Zixibacteria bacterium]